MFVNQFRHAPVLVRRINDTFLMPPGAYPVVCERYSTPGVLLFIIDYKRVLESRMVEVGMCDFPVG